MTLAEVRRLKRRHEHATRRLRSARGRTLENLRRELAEIEHQLRSGIARPKVETISDARLT